MIDDNGNYWWCFHCGKIELIENEEWLTK
jgi:hypothetical protein